MLCRGSKKKKRAETKKKIKQYCTVRSFFFVFESKILLYDAFFETSYDMIQVLSPVRYRTIYLDLRKLTVVSHPVIIQFFCSYQILDSLSALAFGESEVTLQRL